MNKYYAHIFFYFCPCTPESHVWIIIKLMKNHGIIDGVYVSFLKTEC